LVEDELADVAFFVFVEGDLGLDLAGEEPDRGGGEEFDGALAEELEGEVVAIALDGGGGAGLEGVEAGVRVQDRWLYFSEGGDFQRLWLEAHLEAEEAEGDRVEVASGAAA
jgi:hypothetical protein